MPDYELFIEEWEADNGDDVPTLADYAEWANERYWESLDRDCDDMGARGDR